MNVLLVHARFPVTYWGFQHALEIVGKRASLPPLGLLTVAALLPRDWSLRLVDLNVEPLDDRDVRAADCVLVGGMLVQADSMREVVARARRLGRRVVVGGPAPTTTPELFADADVVFRGEAEGRVDTLIAAIDGTRSGVLDAPAGTYPDLALTPVPRYDLVDLRAYASASLQYSRGCPFHCEFCDVIAIFGKRPRVKAPAQVLAELEAIRSAGHAGTVFFVDDNFIGNRREVRALLPAIEQWQIAHRRAFELYTEASVNLARDEDLLAAMTRAGFGAVFVGIETPSTDALAEAGKTQNLALDLGSAVEHIARSGIEVMAGFIVGFDADTAATIDAQRAFIEASPIPLAMVGMLTALPGTALHRRLGVEGRLRARSSGDQFARPNFEPRMCERTLLRGYSEMLGAIYAPDAFYARCAAHLELAGPADRPGGGNAGLADLLALARTVASVGIASARAPHFWKLLTRAIPHGRSAVRWAIAHALMGEHLLRYTEEHVCPRLARAIGDVEAQPGLPSTRPRISIGQSRTARSTKAIVQSVPEVCSTGR